MAPLMMVRTCEGLGNRFTYGYTVDLGVLAPIYVATLRRLQAMAGRRNRPAYCMAQPATSPKAHDAACLH